ncbi:MAG: hypothetical protein LBJ39_06225 [Tannerellaceae bacterium]|jgi:hypothetical protein|nr:hypothetical protein [Tannerellaceae bacterium]
MKKNNLLFFTFLLMTAGCGGDYVYDESLLVGQWQEIARGNPDITDDDPLVKELGIKAADLSRFQPDGHIIEFLENGTRLHHSSNQVLPYEADKEFIYHNKGNENYESIYRYTFTGPKILRLDFVKGNMVGIWPGITYNIYKRIQ